MKKIQYIVIFLAGFSLLFASCRKTKTYAEHLKDETKAIEKFISQNRLTVLDKFPADTVFKANEFYRDPATGVYFNIIERGESKNKAKLGSEIYVRYSGLRYFARNNDTIKYSNTDPIVSPWPETIIYRGPVTMRSRDLYSRTTPAWVVPLSSVGHNGKVRLIVPFNMGNEADRANFSKRSTTSYYETVQYRFEAE